MPKTKKGDEADKRSDLDGLPINEAKAWALGERLFDDLMKLIGEQNEEEAK